MNLTAVVTGAGTYNLVMASTSSTGTSFSSRQGANPPQLVIVTSPVCPAGSSALAADSASLAPECQPLTPTLTATPICNNQNVAVISQATFQTYPADRVRELLNTLAVNAGGTAVLSAPTLNAKKLNQVNWGTSVKVYARAEFAQTGFPTNQVWYQVGAVGSTTHAGWMIARYEGLNYTLGNDPCSVGTVPNFTFTYDRQAAANYAIQHSYDTLTNFSTLQSSGRVTQQLTGLPYAYFRYKGLGQQQLVTGSAVFVSESIWFGGLPMTWGDIDSCTTAGGLTKGWRFCFTNPQPPAPTPPFGESSNPFDTHDDLYSYWGNNGLNTVLGNIGQGLLYPGGSLSQSTQYIWGGDNPQATAHDLSTYNGTTVMGNIFFGIVANPAGLSNRVQQLLTTNTQNRAIQMGDYVFINTTPAHGLLVVGWQQTLNCSDAYQRPNNWTVNDFGTTYLDAQTRGIQNPVPYVADFTDPSATQRTTPRPFYCTRYSENGTSFFSAHNWLFFALPDSVTLPNPMTNPNDINRLYVDPDWQW